MAIKTPATPDLLGRLERAVDRSRAAGQLYERLRKEER